jgi:hypothetical protein
MPDSSTETPQPGRTSDVLLGATLSRIEKQSFSWTFHFGDAVHLNVEAPWRVLSKDSILVTSEDDGQTFGLATPVDALATIRQLLENRRVTFVGVDAASSDLRLRFDNEVVLQIVNLSSGFECWVLNCDDGFIVVGRNGCC